MILKPIPEWHWDALCARRNPDHYTTENIPHASRNPLHHVAARDLCKGCPVMAKCAQEALDYEDTSMVRAGVPLMDSYGANHAKGYYDALRFITETGTFPPLPDPVQDAEPEMAEYLPPLNDNQQFLFGGSWYVSRMGAAELLGISARTLDNQRSSGKLLVCVRHLRQEGVAGQARAFYQVDELLKAKENLDNVRRIKQAV